MNHMGRGALGTTGDEQTGALPLSVELHSGQMAALEAPEGLQGAVGWLTWAWGTFRGAGHPCRSHAPLRSCTLATWPRLKPITLPQPRDRPWQHLETPEGGAGAVRDFSRA